MNLDCQALPVTPLDLSFSFVMEALGSVSVLLTPRNSRWTANGVPCALDSGWTYLLSSEELRLQDFLKPCSEVHGI